MPRRSLGALKNLGKWASGTTKKTRIEKAKKGTSEPTPRPSGKENKVPVCKLTILDTFFHLISREAYPERQKAT